MRGLDRVLNLIPRPEKAPEPKPKPKWLGPEPVGPPDEVRSRIQERQKVQPIDQAAFVEHATKEISAFVNAKIIPVILETVEEKMATNADLQPIIQNVVQVLQQFTAKQAEVMQDLNKTRTELADAKVAIEAQTNKYKATCDERDAALHREQVALQEGDKVKAQLEQLTQVIVNLHLQATNAVGKPVA